MTVPGEQRHLVLSLDGLRGVAAAAVVLLHVSAGLHHPVAGAAYLAVDLFFVLSGFVVARAYEERLIAGLGWQRFLVIRLRRLYPLYALALLVGFLYALSQALGAPQHHRFIKVPLSLLPALCFLPTPPTISVDQYQIAPLVIPAWSLFFELTINLAYALTIRWLSTARLTAIAVATAAALIVVAVAFGDLDVGPHWNDMLGGFARVGYGFSIGVLLGRRWTGFRLTGWIAPALILVLLAGFLLLAPVHASWLDLPFALIGSPMIVFVMAHTRVTGPLARACAWSGSLSYAAYILHGPMVKWFELVTRKYALQLQTHPGSSATIVVLAIFAISWAADVYYDAPMRARLARRRVQRCVLPDTRAKG